MIPRKLLDEIERWIRDGKYGHLQINFSGGKIVNLNRVESIKVDMIITNHPDTKVTLIPSIDTVNLNDN